MAKKKDGLNRNTVRLLRKVQKFLIEEPRRFNMRYGIVSVNEITDERISTILEEPPCGTMCCIAGAAYVVATNKSLNHTEVTFSEILDGVYEKANVDFTDYRLFGKLFYIESQHGRVKGAWPKFYEDAYLTAKTPLERACVGVARIEHFIATDGRE
jgi:hypothetical protein